MVSILIVFYLISCLVITSPSPYVDDGGKLHVGHGKAVSPWWNSEQSSRSSKSTKNTSKGKTLAKILFFFCLEHPLWIQAGSDLTDWWTPRKKKQHQAAAQSCKMQLNLPSYQWKQQEKLCCLNNWTTISCEKVPRGGRKHKRKVQAKFFFFSSFSSSSCFERAGTHSWAWAFFCPCFHDSRFLFCCWEFCKTNSTILLTIHTC